jgi:DNA-directed RNA polymerase specialized sigma24 family protein
MYTDGYKYREIAQQTGVPMGTVKTRMHVGRIQLKKMLKVYE